MKQVNGIWFPDSETHMTSFVERDGSYQKHTLDVAVSFCDQKRVALDIGGHCGLWSMHLENQFDEVNAFEPVEDHKQCFLRNTKKTNLYGIALGAENGECMMHIEPDNTGHTHVNETGVLVPQRRLDEFHFDSVDFMKIDCEGYEFYVILGGKETILENKPVMCVEQKPHGFYGIGQFEAVELLVKWGAKVYERVSADFILGWT